MSSGETGAGDAGVGASFSGFGAFRARLAMRTGARDGAQVVRLAWGRGAFPCAGMKAKAPCRCWRRWDGDCDAAVGGVAGAAGGRGPGRAASLPMLVNGGDRVWISGVAPNDADVPQGLRFRPRVTLMVFFDK